MKKLLGFIVLLAIVFVAAPVWAADINLRWDAVTDATGYRMYRSVDSGVTWTMVQEVGDVTTVALTGQPDTGIVLYRVAAFNANGEAIRSWSGAWYNNEWKPPADPGGAGID